MNCPFYGRHLSNMREPFTLIESRGNECAIATEAYTPCAMQTAGDPPDWKHCPRVDEITITYRPEL